MPPSASTKLMTESAFLISRLLAEGGILVVELIERFDGDWVGSAAGFVAKLVLTSEEE